MVVIGLWNYVLVGYVVLFIFSISIIVDGFFCANYSPRSNFYIINPPGGAGGDSYYSVGLFATTLGVADSSFLFALGSVVWYLSRFSELSVVVVVGYIWRDGRFLFFPCLLEMMKGRTFAGTD